jgi:lipid II:glycine glycyltransferase (peptidoglycan interpeptide bridge formation enzyme)
METAKKMLIDAKENGYPSAFITAFEDEKKINVNEALLKLNNKPNEN